MGNNHCCSKSTDSNDLKLNANLAEGKTANDNAPVISFEQMDLNNKEEENKSVNEIQNARAINYEVTEDFQSKVKFLQNRWKKYKEREVEVETIRIRDNNSEKEGTEISVNDFNQLICPTIENVRSKNKPLEEWLPYMTTDDGTATTDLKKRPPYKYNLDNSVYYGMWNKDGFREGYGIDVKPDGTVHEGLFTPRFNKGRVYNTDGSYIEGRIYNGLASGISKIITKDGDLFSGVFSDGDQLMGMREFADGQKFSGTFKNNMFNGNGSYKWADGSTYEGEFKMSSINGKGVYKSSSGDEYQGEWVNNRPHGPGVYIYPKDMASPDQSCPKYIGNYSMGRKEGRGEFTHTKNVCYKGEWKGGLPHGNGLFKYDKRAFDGLWRFGKLAHIEGEFKKMPEVNIKIESEKLKTTKKDLAHLNNQVYVSENKAEKKIYRSVEKDIIVS